MRRNFPVQGMGCAACVARVENTLKACKGVSGVTVSLASNSAQVDYDPAVTTPSDLQKAVQDAGYDLLVDGSDDEADSEAEIARQDAYKALQKDTVIACVLAALVMLLSMGFNDFPGKGFVLWALATPVVFWCGRRFFKAGFSAIRHGSANMDTLVALSVSISYLFSVFNLLFPQVWTSQTAAIRGLMGLQAKETTARPGETLLVKPGERLSVDGVVTEGSSYVDESMLTGEPVPALKQAGARVYAGTINQHGALTVRVDKVGGDTLLSGIIRMVRDAQGSKAPIMVTVLVIACPCSLGLATPTAIIAGIGNGASKGILIKDAESLQIARKVNAMVMDKTGTLTEGKPSVVESVWDPSITTEDDPAELNLRDVLYSLEHRSDHPLAHAVCDSLRGCEELPVEGFEAILGKGLCGTVRGTRYYVGNLELLKEVLDDIPEATNPMVAESIGPWMDAGYSVTLLFDRVKVYAVLALSDDLKDTSVQAVKALQAVGIEIHMLTGDNEVAARHIAEATGIQHVKAHVLPQDKADYVRQLQAAGKRVAMVGDGINDSAALAQADLGIAMGEGSDIAIDTAQVTIVSSDLSKLRDLIRLSRRTTAVIRENLFWAFIYNILAVPIAAGILYPFTGFLLNPMVAAACMALSSVCVVSNSLRLRK